MKEIRPPAISLQHLHELTYYSSTNTALQSLLPVLLLLLLVYHCYD